MGMMRFLLMFFMALPAMAQLGPHSFTNGNVVWVDGASGNDTTAMKYRRDKPYKTLPAAKTASISGDGIYVGPSTYSGTDLAKNGVRWYFADGAINHYTNQVVTTAAAMFDDGGLAMTFSVDGYGEFIFGGNQNSVTPAETYIGQIVWLKNAASKVHFRAKRCAAAATAVAAEPVGLIILTSCSNFFGSIDLLEDTITSGSSGIIWQHGNAEIDVQQFSIHYYPILAAENSGGGGNTKCTIRAGRIESLNFNPAVTLEGVGAYSFHLTANEVMSKDSHTPNSGGLLLGAGNSEINIGRLVHFDAGVTAVPSIFCSGGTHTLTIGRIKNTLTVANTGGIFARVTAGSLDLSCPVFESSGTFSGDGIVVTGGTFNYHGPGRLQTWSGRGMVISGGVNFIDGLRVLSTNAVGVHLSGSHTTRIKDSLIQTVDSAGSGDTNWCIQNMTNGLTVQNVVLLSPSSTVKAVWSTNAGNHLNIQGSLWVSSTTNSATTVTNGTYKEGGAAFLSVAGGSGGPSSSNNIPVLLAYTGTNVVIDASLGTVFRLILTNASAIPAALVLTNGSDTQTIEIQLYQDATGNRLALTKNNGAGSATNHWNFGEDITGTPGAVLSLSTNAFKMDRMKLSFIAAVAGIPGGTNRWDVVGELHKY